MRIRKLSLQGFKSFADRAVFQFGDGIAGVVGPNGCGKSNVMDAVKWCVGEQSAKSLRGDSMADVIFAGSIGRTAVSFAEVSLTFSAADEPFPGIWARFAEIDVTRRLYRDGHSEYLINQERVRLRDFADLFMDSGVGNQLYSFIEQGRIGQIVHARPEQRRSLIEEAAGISRYKARREETLQKLESTRTALDRVTDLSDEMTRQLRAAERAVQRAARWRWLGAKVRQEEVAVGLIRCAGLVGDRRALSERARGAREEVEESGRAVERHEQDLAARREVLERLDEEVGRLRDCLGEREGERRVEESALQYQARETDAAKGRLERLALDADQLRGERDTAAAEAVQRRGLADAADQELGRLRVDAERTSEIARAEGQRVAAARASLDGARRAAVAALEAAVRARATLAGMDGRRADLTARRERHAAREAGVQSSHGRVDDEIRRFGEQVSAAEAALTVARQAVEAERSRIGASEQEQMAAVRALRAAENALVETTRARATVSARVDALNDQERRHVDAPDGARAALGVPGAIGTLASQLDVPEGLDSLLARALDGALEAVLVPDVAAAVAAARAVKAGRARILVVPDHGEPEGVMGEVRGTPAGRRALARLVGRVELVDDVAAALAGGDGRRYVTRDGAVVREDGLVTLGNDAQAGTATLRRRRELVGLQAQVLEADGKLAAAQRAVEQARAEVVAAEERVRGVSAAIETARAELRVRETTVGEARHRLDLQRAQKAQAVRLLEELIAEATAIERAAEALEAEAARAQAALAEAEGRQGGAEAAVRAAQGILEAAEPALALASERVSKLRVDTATAQRDALAHREAETAATQRAERAAARATQVERERTDLEARLVQLAAESA